VSVPTVLRDKRRRVYHDLLLTGSQLAAELRPVDDDQYLNDVPTVSELCIDQFDYGVSQPAVQQSERGSLCELYRNVHRNEHGLLRIHRNVDHNDRMC
jgi:hypothetical protein